MASKGGRPTKFKEEFIDLVAKLAKHGLTDEEMAEVIGVSPRTFYQWKSENKKFLQAIKVGKKVADDRVERSLYSRAIGYTHPEVQVFNNKGEIVTHEVIKQYAPDTTAAIFWLKNRRPKFWRDSKDITSGGEKLKPMVIDSTIAEKFLDATSEPAEDSSE